MKIKIRRYIKISKQSYKNHFLFYTFLNFIVKKSHSILISINFIMTIYLLVQNNRINTLNKELSSVKSEYKKEDLNVDEDMVGLKYPKIQFEKIKTNFLQGKIISNLLEFFFSIRNKINIFRKRNKCN